MNNYKQELISVIVPVYNVENYVKQCVTSIMNQSYTNLEIILVDDGSTDKSGKICDELSKLDQRIRVIHKENRGVSAARNEGIKQANGKYIMFCDSDDAVNLDWCKVMYEQVEINEHALVISEFNYHFEHHGNVIQEKFSDDLGEKISNKDFMKIGLGFLMGSVWNKIYLTTIINNCNVRFNEIINYAEDLRFNLDYIKHINEIVFVRESLYVYNIYEREGLCRKYSTNRARMVLNAYGALKKTCIDLDGNFEEYKEMYYTAMFNSMLAIMQKNDEQCKLNECIVINNYLLSTKEFKDCMYCANKDDYDWKIILALKTKNWFWVKVVICFSKISQRIKGE